MAAAKFVKTPEQIAADKAHRTELRAALDSFEVETEGQQDAYDRLTERYSHLNSLLIIMQCPATRGDVKAKSAWAAEGLGKIRKGQHGLLIRKPVDPRNAPADADTEDVTNAATGTVERKRYIWVRVYDRSQMEAFPEGWNQGRRSAPARGRQAAAPAPAPTVTPAAVRPATPSRHAALDAFLS